MSISLLRIDDRLIHGQVVMTWIRHIQCTQIKIVDQKTANDEFMCKLLLSVAPKGISLEIMGVEEAVAAFSEWESSDENVMVIVRSPMTLQEMASGGIVFKSINVGGIAISANRKKFHKNVALTEEEEAFLFKQVRNGVDVYYQMIVSERRVPVTEKMFK